jgi:hypothetical protein
MKRHTLALAVLTVVLPTIVRAGEARRDHGVWIPVS